MASILQHLKQKKRVCSFSQKMTRGRKRKIREDFEIWTHLNPSGIFAFLPLEVSHLVFKCTPLKDLGALSLSSRTLRDMVVNYLYSPYSSEVVVPIVTKLKRETQFQLASLHFHGHYKNLGILVKRSSCLFSTKERLRKVGQVLDKLRDAHVRICNELGSDLAYSCYGQFLHTFVAGWEYEEKTKAFNAIKGASLLEERVKKVLKAEPGRYPGYERYIRVFCREIFLDKSETYELSFWLAQILKQWPMCFQSTLLFILYGPIDEETDEILWELVTTSSAASRNTFTELGRILRVIWNDSKNIWNADDAVSLFEELTSVPSEWDIECISSLLSQCGENFCCEVLGNKAINGRTRELSYLLFHIWQRRFTWNAKTLFGKREQSLWILSLIRNLSNAMKNEKTFNEVMNQLFHIWEECIVDGLDDYHYASDSQAEEEETSFRSRLQSMVSLVKCLLP